MQNRRTVLLLVPHLGGGGAERVTAHLAAELPEERYCVHLGLVTAQNGGHASLPARVQLHELGARRVRAAWWRLLRLIWRVRPDVIVSNMFHLNFLLLLLKPLLPRGTKCVIRQNGMTGPETGTSATTRALYRLLYPRAERVICQTEAMASEMEEILSSGRNLRVLPNPVESPLSTRPTRPDAASDGLDSFASALKPVPQPQLLAVGRLAHEKGFDLLLRAFAAVLKRFPKARLTILGEGREAGALKELARKLGITGSVSFAGYVDEPGEWFELASVFVLSSRREAMPNALLEAASAGLPIVATPAWGDVKTGAAALFSGAQGTWLARAVSSEALAESLLDALNALDTLRPMQRFPHAWLEPFRMENAMAGYENLIEEMLAEAVR